MLLPSSAVSSDQRPQQAAGSMRADERSIEFGKSLVKDVPDEWFVEIAFSDLPSQRGAHIDLCSALFVLLCGGANPFIENLGPGPPPGLRVRVFAAKNNSQQDLLEYRWTFQGQPWRVLASRNAVRLDLDLVEFASRLPNAKTDSALLNAVKAMIKEAICLDGKNLGTSSVVYHNYATL